MKQRNADRQEESKVASRRAVLKGGAAAAAGAATLGFPMIAKAQGPISMRWQSTWPQKDIFHEYALENFRHHLREDVAPQGADPCSSARWLGASDDAPILSPRTWLLRQVPDAFTSSPPEQRGVPAGVAARESRQVPSESVRAAQRAS